MYLQLSGEFVVYMPAAMPPAKGMYIINTLNLNFFFFFYKKELIPYEFSNIGTYLAFSNVF